jgi:glycosyltransferase involved in cell wall biosynthesis
VVLLAHWLPSLVTSGGAPPAGALSPAEAAALAEADAIVAPSAFMAKTAAELGAEGPASVVEPGLELAPVPVRTESDVLRAIVVANVVPGKGVLGLVEALAPGMRAGAPMVLTIVGSLAHDPAYAASCRARAEGVAAMRFVGERPHAETLAMIAASDLLVSASRMESYGMALAEARALGVPIVARAGGNAASHVDERAGGRLVADDAALAAECLLLARDRAERARRAAAARQGRPAVARSWDAAADDFIARVLSR